MTDASILALKGVSLGKYGYRVTAKIGKLPQRERHFKFETPNVRKKILAWQEEARSALRKIPQPASGRRGTFGADAKRYLEIVKPTIALETYRSRVCEIEAYVALFRNDPRHGLTRDDMLDARHYWLTKGRNKRKGQKGTAPKTIINRERALHHMFGLLDGPKAPTPLDDLEPLKPPSANPMFVPVATIKAVLKKLVDPVIRARFMVLASTGQRPAQLKRAQPEDVDLVRRLWSVRRAKGGNPIPVHLTDDMIAAFQMFIQVAAWGTFDSSDFARAIRAAGWPADVPPYNLKHTVALALAEAGAEWEDIKDFFGQTDVKTTRIYTGLVASRARGISQHLHGRFGWTTSLIPAQSDWKRRNVTDSGGISADNKKGRLKRRNA